MARSFWKGNYLNSSKIFYNNNKVIFLKNSSIISKSLKDSKVLVNNGLKFSFIFIQKSYIGLKIGEFCFTRKLKKK